MDIQKMGNLLPMALNSPEQVSSLTGYKQGTLANHEEKILVLKYADTRIKDMAPRVFLDEVMKALVRINAITGWKLPDEEVQVDLLVEQVSLKLIESYQEMNFQEIEYAFRSRAFRVSNWGANFNIGLLDTILQGYLQERYELSLAEENRKLLTKLESSNGEDVQPISDDEFLHNVFDTYQRVGLYMIPVFAYDLLVKNGKINLTREQKNEYMKQAENAALFPGSIENKARQLAVRDYFNQNPDIYAKKESGDQPGAQALGT